MKHSQSKQPIVAGPGSADEAGMGQLAEFSSNFPSNAGVWLFPFSEPLSPQQSTALTAQLGNFLQTWKSHQVQLSAQLALSHRTLLAVMTESSYAEVSGCAKDELARKVRASALMLGISIVPELDIVYVDDKTGDLKKIPRERAAQAVSAGEITSETPILHKELTTLSEFKEKLFIPAGSYWTKMYFQATSPKTH